jgi:hypothetical protein
VYHPECVGYLPNTVPEGDFFCIQHLRSLDVPPLLLDDEGFSLADEDVMSGDDTPVVPRKKRRSDGDDF